MSKQDSEKRPYVEGFEELVLGAVYRLKDDAYGVTIWQTLEESGRKSALGAIYATLERLEDKGFVKSRIGEATKERGGRAKKFFEIEGLGIDALLESQRTRNHILPGVLIEREVC